ncbi:hypothetical protein EGW08_005758 [Elysia chlorotica]|uniref:Mutator-like transposase domain-containing protein n=1 Tax=Elysia chlorotica TaxID=188477 RepID=A0A3S1AA35_ELYCH|nr:hypothetical protein EGW08_005758 [Elysia chlorotica]
MPRTKCSKRHQQLVRAREMKKNQPDPEEQNIEPIQLGQDLDLDTSLSAPGPSNSESRSRSASPASSDDDESNVILDLAKLQSENVLQNESLTRTEKKIILCGREESDRSSDEDDGSRSSSGRFVVDADQVASLICSFPCRECLGIGTLTVHMKERWGLAAHLSVTCSACGESFDWWSSKPEKTTGKGRQRRVVNKTAVFASLSSGMGAFSFNVFCEYMDLPGLHHKTFQSIAESLYSATDDIRNVIFSRAAETVRSEHHKLNPLVDIYNDPLDIAVSYDGTWLTRGHSSKVGIGCVINVLTGLVLDAHVMSTYCHTCDSKTGLREADPKAYETWEQAHLGSGTCNRNFHGTSGMMEAHAMKILWLRSLRKHNMRYVTVVSDGDAKAYNAVFQLQPYGPDCPIEKEDCINHVCKRMGTALRNLVSDASKRKVTLGGRGAGRLTQKTISRLTTYYERAIRQGKSAADMKSLAMAAIYHGFSTDRKPQHHFCPPGVESWCFFNAAIASGSQPGSHATFVHYPLDQGLLEPYLLPIYERLTDPVLLKRCEGKATQNANESLHNSIWSKCPKHKFYSRHRVDFAAALGISEFNSGHLLLPDIRTILGCGSFSEHAVRLGNVRLNKRAAVSRKEARERITHRRQKVREAKRRRQEELEAEEGGPAYGAGLF